MTIGRIGSKPYLVLEDNLGTFDDLVTIKTRGKYRREMIAQIKLNLESWMKNPHFESVRTSPLDLAIVARVNPDRMRKQDIDNIAKVVIDTLKKTDGDPRFLFQDDCQICVYWFGSFRKRSMPDITLIVLQSHSVFMMIESKWCWLSPE